MALDLSPLWISLKIALTATLITFGLGTTIAYKRAIHLQHRQDWLEGLFLAPLVIPPTVLGFLLLLLLGQQGPIGPILGTLRLRVVFTWYAAVVTATIVAFPLMYKTAKSAFEQIDHSLLQAARSLGASEFRVFRQIAFPLALPGILTGVTLTFARALGEFGATLMVAGNIPGRTQTLSMAIYFAVEAGDYGEAAFWSIGVLAIVFSGLGLLSLCRSPRAIRKIRSRVMQSKGMQTHNPYLPAGQTGELNTSKTADVIDTISPDDAISPHSRQCLKVNIHKQLSDFCWNGSFQAQQPTLGILGASGAGKSLLLRCIAGIETPDRGQIKLGDRILFDSVQGINVASCDRNVSILFQNYALFPHLTVAENIAFGLKTKSTQIPPRKLQPLIHQELAAVHLETLAHRYPHELSGGQQQRVALARALASQPDILLLDEPFSAIDTHLRHRIEQQLIERLQTFAGITIFVTHNLEEAYRSCQNLMVLSEGQIIAHGPKQIIFDTPQTVKTAQITGCKNFSRAYPISAHRIKALDWQCELITPIDIPTEIVQVGYRAHQIKFVTPNNQLNQDPTQQPNIPPPNCFPGWVSHASETQHRMTLHIKLHHPPTSPQDYHLQAEVFKERWTLLKSWPQPWTIQLEPTRLILLQEKQQLERSIT